MSDLDFASLGLVIAAIGALGGVAVLISWTRRRPRLSIRNVSLSELPSTLLPTVTQFWITLMIKNGWRRAPWFFSYATDITARIAIYDVREQQTLEELSSGVLWGKTLFPGKEILLRQALTMRVTEASYDVSIILEHKNSNQGKPCRFTNVPVVR